MLSLADAHIAINKDVSDTTRDADLTAVYIPAVQAICENIAGPIMATSATWTVDGGKTFVELPSAVTAVTSVTETGTVLTPGVDYVVNKPAGLIYRGTIASPFIFLPGYQNIVVAYTAGYASDVAHVTPLHREAARIILAQLWQADLIGFRSAGVNGDGGMPTGFAVPARARELLMATPNVPGFA